MVTVGPRRSAGREGTPVLSAVNAEGSTESGSMIDEIVREGARRMLLHLHGLARSGARFENGILVECGEAAA